MITAELDHGASLDLAVECVLASDGYREAVLAAKPIKRRGWRAIPAEQRFHKAVFLDGTVSRRLRAAVTLANATVPAMAEAGGDAAVPTVIPPEERDDPVWFFRDPSLPPVVVEGMLAARRAELEMLFLHFLTVPIIRHFDVLRECAVLWERDMRVYARFVAAIAPKAIPTHLVPAADRADIASERERRAATLATLAELRE